MAMTYDYQTGKITRDWHLVKHDEICRLRDVPARVGAYGCEHCPFNKGIEIDWSAHNIEDQFYTKCIHKDAKDSEGSGAIIRQIIDKFEYEAMCAFYD